MNLFLTLTTIFLVHASHSSISKDAIQYVPVPLDYEDRGVFASSHFTKRGGWTSLAPESNTLVQFITPKRRDMLGPRTNEWFDTAYLRLIADQSGKSVVGVVQPLGDRYPVTAGAGDTFRVGLNLRSENTECANVVVQLRDVSTGHVFAVSQEIEVNKPQRHFVDLVLPTPHNPEAQLAIACIAVPGSHDSEGTAVTGPVDFGAVHVDQISVAKAVADEPGFQSLFDGATLEGWTGNLDGYGIEDGSIRTFPERAGGNIYTEDEFDNFIFRFKFKLEPGANNGIGIRTPLIGDAAFEGMITV